MVFPVNWEIFPGRLGGYLCIFPVTIECDVNILNISSRYFCTGNFLTDVERRYFVDRPCPKDRVNYRKNDVDYRKRCNFWCPEGLCGGGGGTVRSQAGRLLHMMLLCRSWHRTDRGNRILLFNLRIARWSHVSVAFLLNVNTMHWTYL